MSRNGPKVHLKYKVQLKFAVQKNKYQVCRNLFFPDEEINNKQSFHCFTSTGEIVPK